MPIAAMRLLAVRRAGPGSNDDGLSVVAPSGPAPPFNPSKWQPMLPATCALSNGCTGVTRPTVRNQCAGALFVPENPRAPQRGKTGAPLMDCCLRIGLSALITGTAASVASTAAPALLAQAEGKSAFQPMNATSHWLHGDSAASHRRPDAAHTLVGYATHHASTLFWAVPFEAWLAFRPPRTTAELLRDACAMSVIAAVIDYGVTPKRLTPGWELVLSKRSMATTYVAMALGFAAGALVARTWLRENEREA
jgi:hypothetical protein